MTSSDRDGAEAASARGDRRWLPSLVVLVLVAIPFLLPLPHTTLLSGAVSILAVPLLIALIAVDPGRVDRISSAVRTLNVLLTIVLVFAAITATAILLDDLLRGAPNLASATTVLWAGGLIWVDTILTFSLLYWELDSGGPAQRLTAPHPYPDLAFPQHMNPELATPGWLPLFTDYLYLGTTNAMAFSPTDVMPLARWAKGLMALQSIISITILSLVIANAVNLLGS